MGTENAKVRGAFPACLRSLAIFFSPSCSRSVILLLLLSLPLLPSLTHSLSNRLLLPPTLSTALALRLALPLGLAPPVSLPFSIILNAHLRSLLLFLHCMRM